MNANSRTSPQASEKLALFNSFEATHLHNLVKRSMLHLILDGAEVHRCDNQLILNSGFSRRGQAVGEKTFFPQPVQALRNCSYIQARAAESCAPSKLVACEVFILIVLLALCLGCERHRIPSPQIAPPSPSQPWYFAVSGDSRNCGDVVMPAIAAGAMKDNAAFYWHLGDLRKISAPDEDYLQEVASQGQSPSLDDYEKNAWPDFIQNQATAFASLPFFLGIGNHETIPPKTRPEFVKQFSDWLDRPELREQRLKDEPQDLTPKTYYHWVRDGIDFINLDNASHDQFDAGQMKWFEAVIAHDASDPGILTEVVGMHEALPESISASHSMDEWEGGQQSGRAVYLELLKLQNESHKIVYVLASHSHFFMDGIFNTEYWRAHGGALPGWIIGTAGAARYPLPPDAKNAKGAKTNVYGYLLASVNPHGDPKGTIRFEFKELQKEDIPAGTVARFTASFVSQCFTGNRQ